MKQLVRFLALALVSSLLFAALPAAATRQVYWGDPNDTAGPLDVNYVEGIKTVSNGPDTFLFTMYEDFGKNVFEKGRVFVFFDSNAGPGWDYKGTVRLAGGQIKMFITGDGGYTAQYTATRPDLKSIEIIVAGSTPPNPNGPMSWWVTSKVKNQGSCNGTCIDRVPNAGVLTS